MSEVDTKQQRKKREERKKKEESNQDRQTSWCMLSHCLEPISARHFLHARPVSHQGNRAHRFDPYNGQNPCWPFRQGPDSWSHWGRLHQREWSYCSCRWGQFHQQAQLSLPVCFWVREPWRSVEQGKRRCGYDYGVRVLCVRVRMRWEWNTC